jgi:hypothetical protein
MYSNYYGWFDRVARGLYALTPQGAQDLELYTELVAGVRSRLRAAESASPEPDKLPSA